MQKFFNFLMVSLAFTEFQVATVEADESPKCPEGEVPYDTGCRPMAHPGDALSTTPSGAPMLDDGNAATARAIDDKVNATRDVRIQECLEKSDPILMVGGI